MAPPATSLAVGHHPNFHHSAALSIDNNSSSRSSEEERDKVEDGSVDELATATKRPRGRPPGSKNKPKTPTYLSVDPQDALRSHVMEVAPGADVASCLAAYARARGCGVSVLNASGSVSGVTFRHHQNPENPSSLQPLFLKGKLDIISLSGTVLPDNPSVGHSSLTVFVAGPNGQVIGGPVEGRLVAEGAVMVVAASFSTATYEKLPFVGPTSDNSDPGMDPNPDSSGHHHQENDSESMGGGQEISYANWFLQQQSQQINNNGRPLYLNN